MEFPLSKERGAAWAFVSASKGGVASEVVSIIEEGVSSVSVSPSVGGVACEFVP